MKETKINNFTELHQVIDQYAARGLFTIHPNPFEPFTLDDMDKLIIPNRIRKDLKRTLNRYGVDRFTLFPGLDSLAAYIEWLQSKHD